MSGAVDLLLSNVFDAFLLLEVILISELLDEPIPILVASISPHLVSWAAVLEFVPPGLLLFERQSFLPFSLEFSSVVVSLPVVHVTELDLASPLFSDVSALLRGFHGVSHSMDFVIDFL